MHKDNTLAAHVQRRPDGLLAEQTLALQTSDWLTARRVSQGGSAYVWRTGTRLPGPVPRRREAGLMAARAAHPVPAWRLLGPRLSRTHAV